MLELLGCGYAVCVSAKYRIYTITYLIGILEIVKQEDGKQNFHLETKFKQKQSVKEPAVQPASPSLGRLSLHSHH